MQPGLLRCLPSPSWCTSLEEKQHGLAQQAFNHAFVQVLKRPHYLLVTLVLCNAAATEVSKQPTPLKTKVHYSLQTA